MAKNFGLDNAVRNVANGSDNSFADNPRMVEICKSLVKLADGFNGRDEKGHFIKGGIGFTHNKKGESKPFPMSFLAYFAVSTEAHKESVFRKGYTKFNEKQAKDILKMLKWWGMYNGEPNLSRNDKVVHAITKYYKVKSSNFADFQQDVTTYWKPWNKPPKTMKEITIGLHVDEC